MYRTVLPLLVVLLLLPAVQAQGEDPTEVIRFDLEIDETRIDIPLVGSSGSAETVMTVTDNSIDNPSVLVPGGTPASSPFQHQLRFVFTPDEVVRGWNFNPVLESPIIKAGESREYTVGFSVLATAEQPFYSGVLNVTLEGQSRSKSHEVRLTAYTPGLDTFNGQIPRGLRVEPEQIDSVPVLIYNNALAPRIFDVAVTSNPCGLDIQTPTSVLVPSKTQEAFTITVRGPTDRFYYASESCTTRLELVPQDNPSQNQGLVLAVQVQGFYFNPVWAFWAVGILLAAVVLVLFAADRKARIEEELLGKPQKPWTIPVERVYLDHLKQRDPRAHYVVRHFLMEEEYASSLLWYREFKRATAGTRSKERIVVSQERRVERSRRKWDRATARPVRKAERLEARLQKRLDRQGRKGQRKQQARWRKVTKKMQAAHEARVKKATEKWEKQAARAQKKGNPVPEKPSFKQPQYPPEPTGDRLLLADHKWNRKAERFRARQVRKQGNLEVRAEKKEARLLHRVRKRVEKVARKLDDPEFVAEHPLLGGRAAAESARKQAQAERS